MATGEAAGLAAALAVARKQGPQEIEWARVREELRRKGAGPSPTFPEHNSLSGLPLRRQVLLRLAQDLQDGLAVLLAQVLERFAGVLAG